MRISAYDAQYISLAESLGAPSITEDARLAKASGGRALSMADYHASGR